MDLTEDEKTHCVYRIYCKDPEIKESYYGSTSNYYQRCHSHKHSAKNYKNPKHGFLVYQKIRDTGGFDNWDFEVIQTEMNKNDARNLEKNPGYWAGYYQKRKEEYLQKVECECGVTTSKIHILKHRRTQRHLNFLANTEN
jgi:hypothetical protein